MTTNNEKRICPHCGYNGEPQKQVVGAETYYICPKCSHHMMDTQSLADAGKLNIEKRLDLDDGIAPSLELPRLDKPLVPCVFIVEDSPLMLKMLTDGVKQTNMAVRIESMTTGEDLLVKYTRAHKNGSLPDLIIIDASLPLLPGTSVAVALRAMEKVAGIPQPAPIIFLTVQPVASIKPTIDVVGNAVYMPKYNAEAHDALMNRVITATKELIKTQR